MDARKLLQQKRAARTASSKRPAAKAKEALQPASNRATEAVLKADDAREAAGLVHEVVDAEPGLVLPTPSTTTTPATTTTTTDEQERILAAELDEFNAFLASATPQNETAQPQLDEPRESNREENENDDEGDNDESEEAKQEQLSLQSRVATLRDRFASKRRIPVSALPKQLPKKLKPIAAVKLQASVANESDSDDDDDEDAWRRKSAYLS
ncbi:hypothetical protein BC830DRAFT_1155179 [Chytriomyces sp. MP71]|nr:hypothetical protein BC830DRAFT_1155179 [Chytriomyces sp. MP71]